MNLSLLSRSKNSSLANPIHCLRCRTPISGDHIVRNLCPSLDSNYSPRAFLYCSDCGEAVEFMVYRDPRRISLEHITILGVPGPDYHVHAKIEIEPPPKALGWFLDTPKMDPWKGRQWDHYLKNWLEAGINAVCAEASEWASRLERTGSPVESKQLERFALTLSMFTNTYYDDPLPGNATKIELGAEYEAIPEAGRAALIRASRELGDIGYRVYHGRALSETWIRESYPELVGALARFARLLPPREKSVAASPERGIILGGLQWSTGVHFVDSRERAAFESGNWDQLPAGSCTMAEKFFRREVEPGGTMRILVHTGSCWSTWRCFGPFTALELEEELRRVQEAYPPQRRLAPRVYEGRGSRSSKIEIYDGLKMVKEISFVED